MRRPFSPFLQCALCSTALALCFPVFGQTTNNYAAFELKRDDNWSPLITQDINGDGLFDLVYGDFTEAVGRELVIYYQDSNGSFASLPQRVEIKSEIIAIGFGDVRDDAGTELILHAAKGVFSLSAGIEGYANNLQPILRFDSLVAIPSRRSVEFLPALRDRDGDSLPDLLLPQAEGFVFFRGVDTDAERLSFIPAGAIATVNDAFLLARRNDREAGLNTRVGIDAKRGIAIEVTLEQPNPFDEFVTPWRNDDDAALLRSANWIPNAVFAEFGSDSRTDLVTLNLDEQAQPQLNIALQTANGFDAKNTWRGSLQEDGELILQDLNGDGRTDLVLLSGDGSEWEARFFINTDGIDTKEAEGAEDGDRANYAPFDFERPNQVLRFDGYDVRLDTLTLPNGNVALSASYYTFPIVEAIRSASINRTQLLFAPSSIAENGSGLPTPFARRPTSQLVESFSAANVRGLSEQMSLKFDVDGDGKRDALYITERGTLAAKRIDDQLQIGTEPFWEYTSNKTVFEFEVLALNADTTPDLILRHGNAITVLVSRDE